MPVTRRRRRPLVPVLVAALVLVLAAAAVLVLRPFGGSAGDGRDAAGDAALPEQLTLAVSDVGAPPPVPTGGPVAGSVSFTISFCGDCTLGTDEAFSWSSSLNAKYEEVGDPAWFFANVVDIFTADDCSVADMEGTLTTSGARDPKQFAFKGDPAFAQILARGGIECATLANNHSADYGPQSLQDTADALAAAGVESFGYERILYRNIKGVKVAFIGVSTEYDDSYFEPQMLEDIAIAKQENAQVIIVYPHWGGQYEYVPNATQVRLGHSAIDAGATLVVGTHPHVIQGYEKYKGRYIVYSLGNFCYGGHSNPPDHDCMIFQQTFTVTDGVAAEDDAVNIIPCSVSSDPSYNNYQPTPLSGADLDAFYVKLEDSNAAIADLSAAVG